MQHTLLRSESHMLSPGKYASADNLLSCAVRHVRSNTVQLLRARSHTTRLGTLTGSAAPSQTLQQLRQP